MARAPCPCSRSFTIGTSRSQTVKQGPWSSVGVIEELRKLNCVQCESLVEIKAMRVDAERQTMEIKEGYRQMKDDAVAEVRAKIEEKCS